MTEQRAILALKKGDKKAFRFLFNLFYDRLVAYIITFTNNKMHAEDVVQQTFVDLWEDRNKLNDIRFPKSYLFSMAYYRYIDSIRKEKKKNEYIGDLWNTALRDRIEDDTEENLKIRIKRLNVIIETLPPKCKEIITMSKLQGYKYSEIAEILGISIKTVEAQMRVAFVKIRKAFEEDYIALIFINNLYNKLTQNK